MQIDHIGIWTHDLERLRGFYQASFGARAGERYTNPRTGFQSYFLTFDGGARLELMQMPGIPATANDARAQFTGLVHLAISVGSEGEVDRLTEALGAAGAEVVSAPRRTGDGYYESVVLDPDGNRVEIVGGVEGREQRVNC